MGVYTSCRYYLRSFCGGRSLLIGTGCGCIPEAVERFNVDDAIILFESLECETDVLEYLREKGVRVYHLPVQDFTVQPLENILQAVRLIGRLLEEGRSVLVSCQGGCGRTGTVVSLFNIVYNCMGYEEALDDYYGRRGCGPESDEQHALLYKAWQIVDAMGCNGGVCSERRGYRPELAIAKIYEYARSAGLV